MMDVHTVFRIAADLSLPAPTEHRRAVEAVSYRQRTAKLVTGIAGGCVSSHA
jgi:hypothetical protein